MSLRVGIIADTAHAQRTGIGNYVWRLLNGLKEKSDDKVIVREILPRPMNKAAHPQMVASSRLFNRSVYSWYPYVAATCKAHDLDILHNPSQVPTFFTPAPRYVITVHDLVPLLFPEQSKRGRPTVYQLLFPRTVRNASHIITVSQSTKRDLVQHLGVSEHKISVIPLAAGEEFRPDGDPREDRDLRHRLGLDRPYILYVGTLEVRKNVPTLIRAFDRLCDQGLPHLLVLTGKLGWRTEGVKHAIQASPNKHRIVLTGFVSGDDLPGLYRGADVFAYPSIYEGFGLPPLEAMASGTPVIASDSSSLPEVIGSAGELVSPHDEQLLAKLLYELLNHHDRRAALTRRGLQQAARFSWGTCIEETLRIYTSLAPADNCNAGHH